MWPTSPTTCSAVWAACEQDMTSTVRTRIAPSPPASCTWARRARAVLLGLCAPLRRRVHPAHRGHRRRPLVAGGGGPNRWPRCAGWNWSTTRARSSRCSGIERYREVIAMMLAAGTAYHCTVRLKNSTQCASRSVRAAKSRDMTALAARAGQAAARGATGRAPVVRFRNPEAAWSAGTTWSRARSASATASSTTWSSPAPTARRPTTSAWWWTTGTCASAMSSAADDHVNNTPRQINILRALIGRRCAADLRHVPMILARRRQAFEASRCGQRHAVRGRRLPARGHAQLPGAAWLEPRRHRAFQPRAADRLVRRPPPGKSPAQWDPAKLNWSTPIT